MHNNRSGFSAIEVVLVITVIALLAFAVWRFMDASDLDQSGTEPTQTEEQAIEDESDLEDAENFLEDLDIDEELDESELQAALI